MLSLGSAAIFVWLCQLSNTSPRRGAAETLTRLATMDLLHHGLKNIQNRLAFVTTDDINWKGYVQLFSWASTLFETYLL